LIFGTATATAGAFGGVVAVLVAPVLIVLPLARSCVSAGPRDVVSSAPIVTTALPPMIAANNLTVLWLIISIPLSRDSDRVSFAVGRQRRDLE
jgi:hypothetical protein